MPRAKLESALLGIDWNANVSLFLKNTADSEILAQSILRLAIWSRQFEKAETGNAALSFIREMQVAAHHVAALTSLALYKPAAAAMRTIFETALYYTYFRRHPSELATLVRDKSFYVSKSDIIVYHKTHTPKFRALEQCFGLVGRIEEWYGLVSSIIHGQIPGQWHTHTDLEKLKHMDTLIPEVAKTFQTGEEIVHHLFLCTVGRELWDSFSSPAKKHLLLNLGKEKKLELGLDTA